MKFDTIKKYKTLLKSDITSFLISFRKRYNSFPIKLLNELSKNTSYKNIKKLIINDISIEPIILIKNINKKYRDLKRKTNPSYFNTVLKAYTKDAIRCSNEAEIKIIYKNYLDDLKKQFNDMDMDLNFCLEGLKAINKEMKKENNKNQ